MRLFPIGITLLLVVAISPVQAVTQVVPVACQAPPPPMIDRFPDYGLYRRSRAELQHLRACLRAERWDEVLRLYFPESRRQTLVDWVVYIDRNGNVFQAVTKGPVEQTRLRGEKFVWAIVFMDGVPRQVKDAVNAPTVNAPIVDSALIVSRRSVNFQRDPLVGAMFKYVVGKFLAGGDPMSAATLADSTRVVELRRLSEDDTDTMYVAQARFGIAENTEVVLSLAPGRRNEFPGKLRSVYANFGNAGVSRWELGLAGGASFGPRTPTLNADTVVTGALARLRPNLYLTTYLNLFRPSLPWQRRSVGAVAGLNLVRGSLLDEVVTGVAFGRLIGDVGLIAGASWVIEVRAERTDEGGPLKRLERRTPRALLALDVRL